MQLRNNQIEPVRIGVNFFREPKPVPSIIVMPTAAGKSIIIAKIAEQISGNLLVLQPSKELLAQNIEKFHMLGGKASIYSASFNQKSISQVTYATIGSIKSIGRTFKQLGFTKLIIDEIHLFPRTLDSMLGQFLKDSEITHVLGLTATPLKLQTNTDLAGNAFSKLVMLTSKSKKGQFFKEIIYVSQVKEMVENKYWSPLIYEQHDIDQTKLVFNSTKADYTEESLNKVYASNNLDDMIISRLANMYDRKSILVFVPAVADAIRLSQRVSNSAAVYGDMDSAARSNAVNGFKRGKIRVIFNVNVLSVGFDHPELDAIICARPTASLAWYYQALGRGSRIAPGKKDCLIVDFSGNVARFGRIECLHFQKENIWKLYGENGVLLTGVPMHEIGIRTMESEIKKDGKFMPYGKYKGKEISKITDFRYLEWALETWTFTRHNDHIRNAMKKTIELKSQTA